MTSYLALARSIDIIRDNSELILWNLKEQQRFASYLGEPDESGCREWQGCRDPLGYGRFFLRGEKVLPHRVAVVSSGRAIPPGSPSEWMPTDGR